MDFLSFFAYLCLALWQLLHPSPAVVEPPQDQPALSPSAPVTVFFANENLERGRLVYQGDTAASIFMLLDDALLQRIESLPDGRELRIKSSSLISCYEFSSLDAVSERQYQCVILLNRQGEAQAGYQGVISPLSLVSTGLAEEPTDIQLSFRGQAAAAVYQHLEVLAYERQPANGAEIRKRGLNLGCSERLDATQEAERYECRQLITHRGILAPFGTNDPIARVGRKLQPEPGEFGELELDWGLPERTLQDLGLGALDLYQAKLDDDGDLGDDLGDDDTADPLFPFPEF